MRTSKLRSRGSFKFFRAALFTLPLLLTGSGALIGASFSSKAIEAKADSSWRPNAKEKEADHSRLAVSAASSTLTSSTQSLSVNFRSQRIEAWANGSSNKNVYVLPRASESGEAWVLPERIDQKEDYDGHPITDDDYPHYDSDVYNISTIRATYPENGHIVVPSILTIDKRCMLDVVGISADCCFDPNTDEVTYEGISEIIIPKTVVTIEEYAFANLPEDVTIYCEAPEYLVDEETGELILDDDDNPIKTYGGNWTDGEVIYDYELTNADKSLLKLKTPSAVKFGTGEDFFLGLKSDEYDLPMYISYQFEELNDDGSSKGVVLPEVHYQEIPIDSTNNPYDAVGSEMGVSSIVKNIDIEVGTNQRVYSDSVTFHNIYGVISEGAQRLPKFEDDGEGWNGEYFIRPTIAYTAVPHFSEFFEMKPVSLSAIGDYLQWEIQLKVNPGETGYGLYPLIRPAMYEANASLLASGAVTTRYQFSSLDQAEYQFTYEVDGQLKTSKVRIGTPVKYVLVPLNQNFRMGFLFNTSEIKGMNVENVKKIDFCGFVIKSDIYDNKTHSIVTRSSVSMRFSRLSLFDNVSEANKTNIALVIIFTYVAYVALFLVGSVAYYFYAKKRFRNDEFHRMNTKRYVLTSIKNFIGFGLIVSAILFVYCRWGLLRNTIVSFNPLDPFVIIFCLLGAIFLGFFIRNMVIAIKNAKKRREALRLKLDQDTVEDGTK